MILNNAVRISRLHPARFSHSPSVSSPLAARRQTVQFCARAAPVPPPEDQSEEMEAQQQKPGVVVGDAMAESFGEGYATRSDEEGFGGIYGGNQSLPVKDGEVEEVPTITITHPEYDKTQGSEVKEKEKGRHHTGATAQAR